MAGLIAQFIVDGMITGCLYALLAVSWGIIYSTTRIFHFAHNVPIITAGYAAVFATTLAGLPLVLGFVIAIMAGAIMGCGTEVFLYRPMKRIEASQFIIFISSLGMSILGVNVVHILFSCDPRRLAGFPMISIEIGPVIVTALRVTILSVSLLAILGLRVYLHKAKAGKALRAVASNPEMAETVGVNLSRMNLLAFAIGSGAVALASVFIGLEGAVTPFMGMAPLFTAFIVTFLGGVGSLAGAVAGGLLLGIAESLVILVLPMYFKVMVSFAILLLVLIVRPRGLFGARA